MINNSDEDSKEEIQINKPSPIKKSKSKVNGNAILMFKKQARSKRKNNNKKKRSKTIGQRIKNFFGKMGCGPCRPKKTELYKDNIHEMVIKPKKEKNKKIDNQLKKTIILDLDGTLVKVNMLQYSSENKKLIMGKYDYAIGIRLKGKRYLLGVKKRPFLEEFLDSVHENYNIILWSEMKKEAASKIIKMIDKKGYVTKKLYKGSCVKSKFGLNKPLKKVPGYEPSQTILIDDNFLNITEEDKNNSLIIPSFLGDSNDKELIEYQKFLKYISKKQNIRPIKYWKYRFDMKRKSANKKSFEGTRNIWKMSLSNKPPALQYKYRVPGGSLNDSSMIEQNQEDLDDVKNKSCNYSLTPSFLNEIVSNNARSELNKKYGNRKKREKNSVVSGPFLHPDYQKERVSFLEKDKIQTDPLKNDIVERFEKIPAGMVRENKKPTIDGLENYLQKDTKEKLINAQSRNKLPKVGYLSPNTRKKKTKDFFNFRIQTVTSKKKISFTEKNFVQNEPESELKKEEEEEDEKGEEKNSEERKEKEEIIEVIEEGQEDEVKNSTNTVELEQVYNLAMLHFTDSTSNREREADAMYRDESLNARLKDINVRKLKDHQLVFKSKFRPQG